MKEIQLTKGRVAVVDDEDYTSLSIYEWHFLHSGKGYAIRYVFGGGKSKTIYMHREIMKPEKHMEIDHVDGDGLNNCKNNLRIATHAENMRNRRMCISGTSAYKGVYFYRNRFVAEIKFNSKRIYIGRYLDERDAAMAYNCAALKLFGEYAHLNEI